MTTPPPSPVTPPVKTLHRIGAALQHREFRLFLTGAFLSNIGTWMAAVAQAWLVLQLTDSPFYLGLDGFASTLPIAIFSFWGGVIADRFDRRKLLLATQWTMMSLALILAIATQLGRIHVWFIIFISFASGLAQSIAWPVYQTVLGKIVPRKELSNAIALNSTQFNLARMLGPMVGAFALKWLGTGGCFYANAVSFLAVIWALGQIRIDGEGKTVAPAKESVWKAVRDGFSAVYANRPLFCLLFTMAASSILGVPMVTLLPVFARDVLQVGQSGLAYLYSAFGAGAVTAGFMVAYLADFPRKGQFVMGAMMAFVAAMIGFASSHSLAPALLCLFVSGFALVSFASVVNTLVQTSTPDHLRGRAISVFVFAFGGFMPVGNFLAGWLAKHLGTPQAILSQGAALGVITLFIYFLRSDIADLA